MAACLNVEGAGSQTYEQGLVSAEADLDRAKFTLKASGGVEGAQYPAAAGAPRRSASAEGVPASAAGPSLTGYRRVLNSALYSTNDYTATGLARR